MNLVHSNVTVLYLYSIYYSFLQETGMYFYPDVDQSILCKHHLIGEGLSPPSSIKDYRVFVQSTGPGSRHLSKDSTVLYEVANACINAWHVMC